VGAAEGGERLDIAIYEFQDADVVAALAVALGRGVPVRLIAHAKNDHAGHANVPFLEALRRHGIPTNGRAAPDLMIIKRRRVPALSHNKVVVHTRQGVTARVWCGSTNVISQGFSRQANIGITIADPELVQPSPLTS
jgi:hypothetical protein